MASTSRVGCAGCRQSREWVVRWVYVLCSDIILSVSTDLCGPELGGIVGWCVLQHVTVAE